MSLRMLILVVSTVILSTAELQAETVTNWSKQGHQLVISSSDAEYLISQYAPNSFSIEQTNDDLQLDSFALKPDLTALPIRVVDQGEHLLISSETVTLEIETSPFVINVIRGDELLASTSFTSSDFSAGSSAVVMVDENTPLMGTGSRVLGMDRRGHRLPLYNRAHYGFETHSEQMYYSLPMIISGQNLAIIWDNPSNGWIDVATDYDGAIRFDSEYGAARLHFSVGDSPLQLTHNLASLTGHQPLPPRWALGMYASRFGYHSQSEVEQTFEAFVDQEFPIDALVIDLYWFGDTIKGTMGNLDWHQANWPDPKSMIARLDDAGVNTILITEPFVLTSSSKWHDALEANALANDAEGNVATFDFYFGNTGLVDVFSDDGQRWFLDQYQRLSEYGVRGWWGDLGEPEVHPESTRHNLSGLTGEAVPANAIHNAYGHQWAAMLHQFLTEQQPEQRPFIMMRSGYVGSQRYGMIPWSGDVNRSWGGLQSQIEISLQMGLQGLGYMHSDIGGFAGGEIFDPELYVRWFQYGVFQPVLRPHAQENIPSEPVFHDYRTLEITRDFARLRYRLMPYIYTMAYQNSRFGTPLMRPTYFIEDTHDNRSNTSQYLFGDALLVHPVTEDGQREVITQLPRGVWFDFWSNEVFEGGSEQTFAAPIEQIPAWVKAGSFIPELPIQIANLSEYRSDDIELHYYHHDSVVSASGEWYEDDGTSSNALSESAYEHYQFSAAFDGKTLIIRNRASGNGHSAMPKQRDISWVIHGVTNRPSRVVIGDQIADTDYDPESQILAITLQSAPLNHYEIHIELAE